MIFQTDVTIDASTAQTSPKDVRLKISKGVITQWSIFIPSGHDSLAHLVIYHGDHPVVPSTEDMDVHGNNMLLVFPDQYEFNQEPFELKLIGWNEDTAYAHTFTVYCVVLPRIAVISLSIVDSILTLLGGILPKRLTGRS